MNDPKKRWKLSATDILYPKYMGDREYSQKRQIAQLLDQNEELKWHSKKISNSNILVLIPLSNIKNRELWIKGRS